jgi:3-keto-disaccharide hydrolase
MENLKWKNVVQLAVAILCLVLSSVEVRSEDKAEEGEWIQLFNGKDLEGWTPKIKEYDLRDNFGNTFHVEDGILKVSYEKYDTFNERFGHLFYDGEFSHYVLRVEYRFVGDQVPGGPTWAFRNSGIMIHGQSPESMEKDQDFPVSIEIQTLGGRGEGERTTANLCTPGTNVVMDGDLFTPHCVDSRSKTYHGDRWVTIEVEVHGNEIIRHVVDGEVVLEYQKPQLDPKDEYGKKLIEGGNLMLGKGTISLQSESHPVEYRKVEIRLLD